MRVLRNFSYFSNVIRYRRHGARILSGINRFQFFAPSTEFYLSHSKYIFMNIDDAAHHHQRMASPWDMARETLNQRKTEKNINLLKFIFSAELHLFVLNPTHSFNAHRNARLSNIHLHFVILVDASHSRRHFNSRGNGTSTAQSPFFSPFCIWRRKWMEILGRKIKRENLLNELWNKR